MVANFEMKELGVFHIFLGIEVWQKEDDIFVKQGNNT